MTDGAAIRYADAWGLLTGAGQVFELARDEIGRPITTTRQPAYRLNVDPQPLGRQGGRSIGGVTDLGDGCAVRFERMDLDLVIRLTQDVLDATLHVGHRGPPLGIPRSVFPLLEPSGLSWEATQAYHVALLSEALALFAGHSAVLHASVVAKEGLAIALTSAGGVGKTTTACALVAQHGFSHMSDDISVLSPQGHVHRSARRMMVYPYNFPALDRSTRRRVSRSGSTRARLGWLLDRLAGADRRRRRISAQDLFGPSRVAEDASLTATVFLRRHSQRGSGLTAVDPSDLAERASLIIENEFALYLEPLRLWQSINPDAPLKAAEVIEKNRERIRAAIARGDTLLLDIGADSDPASSVTRLLS